MFVVLLMMAPPSQELEPPANPGRFKHEQPADFVAYAESLRSIAEMRGLKFIAAAINEAIIERVPEDTSLRFRMGYAYADGELRVPYNDLALMHYDSIPEAVRDSVTWNNIGVSLGLLNMPALAVEAYNHSAKGGDGLAESNLAQKLVSVGFFAEARQRLQTAVTGGKEHPNVPLLLGRLAGMREAEEKAKTDALRVATEKQVAIAAIGRGALEDAGVDLVGAWQTPEGLMVVARSSDGSYVGKSETEEDAPLAGLFRNSRTKLLVVHELKLARFGNTFEGTISRLPNEGAPTGLLSSFRRERSICALLHRDRKKLRVLNIDLSAEATDWIKIDGLLEPPAD